MKRISVSVVLAIGLLIFVPMVVLAAIGDELGADDVYPVWSPNSQQIAFTSWRTGNADIWIVNADGTGLRNLTESPTPESNPNWSPDGQRIVFTGETPNGNREIYIMNAQGGGAVNLTNHPESDSRALWSSTGEWILFESRRSNKVELYIMRPDGSDVQQVTNTDAPYYTWRWSPDGRYITYTGEFILDSDRVGFRIYDTTTQQTVDLLANYWFRNPTCCAVQYDWSPLDGEIAFMLPNDGTLYRVNIATGMIRTIAYLAGSPRRMMWLPDGEHLVVALNNNPGVETPGAVGNYRVDVNTGIVELVPGTGIYPYFYPAPDNTHMARIGFQTPTQLQIYLSDGTIVQDTPIPFTNIFGEDWSPDSRYFAISLCETPESDADIYVFDAQTGQLTNATEDDAFIGGAAVDSQCPIYG